MVGPLSETPAVFGAKAVALILPIFVSRKSGWRVKEKRLEQTLKRACRVGTNVNFQIHNPSIPYLWSHALWEESQVAHSISLSFFNRNSWNLVSRHIFSRWFGVQNFSTLYLVLSNIWNFLWKALNKSLILFYDSKSTRDKELKFCVSKHLQNVPRDSILAILVEK